MSTTPTLNPVLTMPTLDHRVQPLARKHGSRFQIIVEESTMTTDTNQQVERTDNISLYQPSSGNLSKHKQVNTSSIKPTKQVYKPILANKTNSIVSHKNNHVSVASTNQIPLAMDYDLTSGNVVPVPLLTLVKDEPCIEPMQIQTFILNRDTPSEDSQFDLQHTTPALNDLSVSSHVLTPIIQTKPLLSSQSHFNDQTPTSCSQSSSIHFVPSHSISQFSHHELPEQQELLQGFK
ncbi:hypothetical protein FRX31_031697 [Thalictrum thalictroides]|uniref:Uncharacterized protein n=1 Tax=Thalictrum thalictroides TaxID=46969 RepID=A0A7J6V3K2_THATH|nr:hypothetical protein FRX31_031697 [Thalictrum thalictroides]